jgi:DNA-3-methyladenine glycosylase I
LIRCGWVPLDDPLYVSYHDSEWGVPLHDDTRLFEYLCLEGAQAGLSWRTILHRREHYRRAFRGFRPERVAAFTEEDVARLLLDPGIVRNRQKVRAAVANAQAVLRIQERDGSLGAFLWGFVGGGPKLNRWRSPAEVPATSPEAQALSRALQREGMRFVGPTICYAFMQATGMVMDHETECFRHRELGSVP